MIEKEPETWRRSFIHHDAEGNPINMDTASTVGNCLALGFGLGLNGEVRVYIADDQRPNEVITTGTEELRIFVNAAKELLEG